EPGVVGTIAEACTNPPVAGSVGALARFLGPDDPAADEAEPRQAPRSEALRAARRVMQLSQGLQGDGYRSEALRRVVLRLARTLESIAMARGQLELVETGHARGTLLDELEATIEDYAALQRSARRRVLESTGDWGDIAVVTDVASLSA